MNNNRTKHKILKVLTKQHFEHFDNSGINLGIDYKSIAKEIGKDSKGILEICSSLLYEDEIMNLTEPHRYIVVTKGISAYKDKKYTRLNRKEFWESISNVTKVIIPIILAVIALITFIINILATKDNSSDIKKLENKIEKLEK